jgi:hypothetical protein
MSSVFRTKNLQDTGIDSVFFLEKSCRKMYTIFSAVQRQQRKSYVMTYFGLTACSAVYYQVPHCRFLIGRMVLSLGQFECQGVWYSWISQHCEFVHIRVKQQETRKWHWQQAKFLRKGTTSASWSLQ